MSRNLVRLTDNLDRETVAYVRAFLDMTFNGCRTVTYGHNGRKCVIRRTDLGIEVVGERTASRGIKKLANSRDAEESIADEMCAYLETPLRYRVI